MKNMTNARLRLRSDRFFKHPIQKELCSSYQMGLVFSKTSPGFYFRSTSFLFFRVCNVSVFCSLTTLHESLLPLVCFVLLCVYIHLAFLFNSLRTNHSWLATREKMYVTFNIQVSLLVGQPHALRSAKPRLALFMYEQKYFMSDFGSGWSLFAIIVYTYVHASLLTNKHMRTYIPFKLSTLFLFKPTRLEGS